MRITLIVSYIEYFVPKWYNCLGRISRCDLVEQGISLGTGFDISKADTIPGLSCSASCVS